MNFLRSFVLLACLSGGLQAAPAFVGLSANSASVERLDKYELSFTLSGTTYSNAFDPAQIDVKAIFTGPLGVTRAAHGFLYQSYTKSCTPGEGLSSGAWSWRVRFSPDLVGAWSVSLTATDGGSGIGTAGPLAFTCVASTRKGLVRVSPSDSRYLQYDDGTQFIPIGQNLAWSTTGGYYSCDFDSWIPKISAQGGNLIRWWFTTFNTAVEWDEDSSPHSVLGDYTTFENQHWRADYILEQARSNQLQVMMTLLNMGDLRASGFENKWGWNVYNVARGGPCANPQDFFTNASAKDYFKRRLRYIVARWGYLPNLIWEPFNELNFVDNYNSGNIVAWHTEMINYIKSLEASRHLVTDSFSDPADEDPAIWSLSGIDMTGFHRYSASAHMEDEHLATLIDHRSTYGKPFLGGEVGIAGGSTIGADPTGVHFHNANWAGISSGAAGAPLFWDWNNYIDPLNLYPHYKALRNFTDAVDFQGSNFIFRLPTVINAGYVTLTVTPDAGTNWGTNYGTTTFTIDPAGLVSPGTGTLNRYLGDPSKGWRNPPTFAAVYGVAGSFSFRCVNQSGSNIVRISVDGVGVLDQSINLGTTYTVPITAGAHNIKVDLISGDWVELGSVSFNNYSPSIKSYALIGPSVIAGWALNRDYNHPYVKANGNPGAIVGASIRLTGTVDGIWDVEWWDTFGAAGILSTDSTSSVGGVLDLAVPNLSRDGAYRLTLSGTVPTATPTRTATPNWTATATPTATPSPSATPSPTMTPLVCGPDWGFESGTTQGWQRDAVFDAGFTAIAPSTAVAAEGTYSLQLSANFIGSSPTANGGVVQLNGAGFPKDLSGRTISAYLHVPAGMSDASIPSGAFLYVKTGPAYTWNAAGWMNLVTYTAWVKLSFDLGAVVGSDDVREIGVKIGLGTGSPDWSGELHLDAIDLGAAVCTTDTPTRTPSASASPSATATPSPSATPSASATPSPSASPTITATYTDVPVGSTLTNTPLPSATATPTPSGTATPTGSLTPSVSPAHSASSTSTRTATPTRSPTPTSTATAGGPGVNTATPNPAQGPGAVIATLPSLNPQGSGLLRLSMHLDGRVESVEVELFSAGYQKVARINVVGPWNAGWSSIALPLDAPSNGVYFYRIRAWNAGRPSGLPKRGSLLLLD